MRRRYSRINSCLSHIRETKTKPKNSFTRKNLNPNQIWSKLRIHGPGRGGPRSHEKQKVIGIRTGKFSDLVKFGPLVILVHGSLTQTLPIFSDSLIGNHVTPEKETKVQKLKKDGASEFKKIKISDSQYVFTMGQIEKAEEKLNNFIKGQPTHFLMFGEKRGWK